MPRPTATTAPIDIDANPHAATYASSALAGGRSHYARMDRHSAATLRASRRHAARAAAEIAGFDKDADGRIWRYGQAITSYAIDGIHPDAPQHRMFGPRESLSDLLGRQRDARRRARILSAAGNRVEAIAYGFDQLESPRAGRHRFARVAFWQAARLFDAAGYQEARASDLYARASRIAVGRIVAAAERRAAITAY